MLRQLAKWKLNVDVVFFEDTNETGIGLVLRGDYGSFVMVRTKVLSSCVEVEVGGAMSFFEVLYSYRC